MDLEDIEAQLVAERLKNEKLMDILKKQEQTIKVLRDENKNLVFKLLEKINQMTGVINNYLDNSTNNDDGSLLGTIDEVNSSGLPLEQNCVDPVNEYCRIAQSPNLTTITEECLNSQSDSQQHLTNRELVVNISRIDLDTIRSLTKTYNTNSQMSEITDISLNINTSNDDSTIPEKELFKPSLMSTPNSTLPKNTQTNITVRRKPIINVNIMKSENGNDVTNEKSSSTVCCRIMPKRKAKPSNLTEALLNNKLRRT